MVTITIKEKEYKLNLRMIDVIALEQELGENPINLFFEAFQQVQQQQEDVEGVSRMPLKFSDMTLVIKYSLRQHHKNMKDENVYALIDEWLDGDGGLNEMIEVVLELMQRFF